MNILYYLTWLQFAMMVGGAVVNALAFSGSNYLFSSMRGYFLVFGKKLDPMPRPTISLFYTLSEEQKDREIAFIMLGLTGVAILGYTITTHKP